MQPSRGVGVELLRVGWFTAPAGLLRAGAAMDEMIRFPVPAYLIETETERILVDTGLNPAAIADPGAYYGRPDIFALFGLEQELSVAEQVDVDTITRLVLTHMHWDHVGGLGLIPATVPVYVQRAEWDAAHEQTAIARNSFLQRDYAGGPREVVLLDGDCDLLGDGSVALISTPGHTPGHQSVRVGDLIIGADVATFAAGLDDHRFPLFADDHAAQLRSAERLAAMRDRGAHVLVGHDPEIIRPGILQPR